MVLAEASDSVTLREQPGLPTMGRPACAAVAWAANEDDVTLSLGCIGARTYVEVPDDRAIVIIPGAALDRVAERLGTLAQANRDLAAFHQKNKADYAARRSSAAGSHDGLTVSRASSVGRLRCASSCSPPTSLATSRSGWPARLADLMAAGHEVRCQDLAVEPWTRQRSAGLAWSASRCRCTRRPASARASPSAFGR